MKNSSPTVKERFELPSKVAVYELDSAAKRSASVWYCGSVVLGLR